MVYESDFYTVRRPYSRPTITSYSVTAPRISVTTWRVKPSIRTSVLIGELDRIHHRSRPHMAYVPTEDFLNSRPLVDFDDETKLIRAETERLMKRIYTSVPHPRSTTPLQIVPYYGHRANDKYNSHRHYSTVSDDIFNMSHYNEPSARTIGRGHLACVSFAGGRGYPRRKHLYLDENRDIQDEIKFRSYYNKNRAYEDAMSLPTGFASYLLRLQPDNRNGTLTSSEKLHITNILKERKGKKSVGDNKEDTTVVMNGVPEKKTSTNKFQSINETVIPIEKETKSYKYKSKDPKPNENHESKINGTISSSNTNIQEKTQQNLSEPKPMPESTSIVQPEERIIEINVEPKVQKENIKSSRKASKTKIQSEEIQLNEIQPKPQDDEKEAVENEIIAEPENVQEEKPCTQESNISATPEVSKEETETDNLTKMVINEFDKKSINNDYTTAEESPAPKESPIITESSLDIDTKIAKESPLSSESPIATDNPIATESRTALESTITQSLSATEKETIDIDITGNSCENIGENLSENIENKNTEEKEDILENNSTKNNIENDDNVIEIVENNILTTEKEVSLNIEQRQTENVEETVFQTRQVIASSTVQETTEVVVTSSQIEIERTQQEPANEPVIPLLEDETTPEDTPQVTNQIEEISNLEESEELVNTKEIRSEDLLNRLNTEVSAEYSTPREKIIEIEIERPDDLEHIIEEVTDLHSHDAQKESDPEPLIEEPQSPESELIYSKTTANDIHEVLSDVAEEA